MVRHRLTSGSDGAAKKAERDASGKFLPGNRSGTGRGNPHIAKVSALKSAMYAAVDQDDVHAVIRKLVKKAKGGSIPAAKLLLAYLFGQPKQSFTLDDESGTGATTLRLAFDSPADDTPRTPHRTPSDTPREAGP